MPDPAPAQDQPVKDVAKPATQPSGKLQLIALAIAVLGIATIVTASAWLFHRTAGSGSPTGGYDHNIVLPMLIIVGTMTLIALAVFALIFSIFNLSDPTQALALPQGSVRAVVALMMIMMYAILTIYLYTSMNAPGERDLSFDTTALRDAFAQTRQGHILKEYQLPLSSPASTSQSASSSAGAAANPPNVAYHLVYEERNSDAVDFAKQILTTLGTLVTAISAFYFGARAATAGANAGGQGGKDT
jgi:hypothetical protein